MNQIMNNASTIIVEPYLLPLLQQLSNMTAQITQGHIPIQLVSAAEYLHLFLEKSTLVQLIWTILTSISQFMYSTQTWMELMTLFAIISILVYFFERSTRPHLSYSSKSRFNQTIIDTCQQLTSIMFPTPWLSNGHMATFWGAFKPDYQYVCYRRQMIPVKARHELFLDGLVALDWAQPESNFKDNTPILFVLHGLSGGSAERYVKVMVKHAQQQNMRVVVFNARGCGGSQLHSAQAYCGAYTEDARQGLAYVSSLYPDAPIFGIGYSLGSNILVKMVGEDGAFCPLTAAISVANPFDLYHGASVMHSTWFTRTFYSSVLTTNLVRLVQRSAAIFSTDPNRKHIVDNVHKASLLRDFDSLVTAPAFGYHTVDHYYRDASCVRYLMNIQRPLLFLSAEDDPICTHLAIPYDEVRANPNLILAVTKAGGHSMDFFQGLFSQRSWSALTANQYIQRCLQLLPSSLKQTSQCSSGLTIVHPSVASSSTSSSSSSSSSTDSMLEVSASPVDLLKPRLFHPLSSYMNQPAVPTHPHHIHYQHHVSSSPSSPLSVASLTLSSSSSSSSLSRLSQLRVDTFDHSHLHQEVSDSSSSSYETSWTDSNDLVNVDDNDEHTAELLADMCDVEYNNMTVLQNAASTLDHCFSLSQ